MSVAEFDYQAVLVVSRIFVLAVSDRRRRSVSPFLSNTVGIGEVACALV